MTINEKLKQAVEPVVSVCVPDLYRGEEPVYCTFHYTERPDYFGDDRPEYILYDIQLHLFLPYGVNPLALKNSLRLALVDAEFSFPSIQSVSDEQGQHYVFEFEGEEVIRWQE